MRHSLGAIATRPLVLICMAAFAATCIGVSAQASPTTASPVAKAAKRVEFVEVARLKLSGEEGTSITERGRATGTYNAPITATFTIRSKSVTATVTVYPHGGSITGVAHTRYKVVKNLGYFGGTYTLGRGTGKYSHASEVNGKALAFSGIINRDTLEVEVKAKGEANL
jgi:hypothetical protein